MGFDACIVLTDRRCYDGGLLCAVVGVLPEKQEMRFSLVNHEPTWANQCHACDQDRIHRTLAYQNVDYMVVWIRSSTADTLAYVDIRYEPMGVIGSYHSYHVLWLSELQRALSLVRNQLESATALQDAITHEVVGERLRRQFRLFRQEQQPLEKVQWAKDGF